MPAAGTPPSFDQAFATLRQFARTPRPEERCELCSTALTHEHPHLVEISSRQIVCACEACATLFDGMAARKYRRVARRALLLRNFHMTEVQWEDLLIPNRIGHAREFSQAEYFIAPMDECYKLVGLIRANWKGLSGGSEVWSEIGRFFSDLRLQADNVLE
jgi:hypothetical protein